MTTTQALLLRGVAIDTSVNRNNWAVEASELRKVAEQLQGKQIRVDHGDKVEDVLGRVTRAWPDGDQVLFEAEMRTGEERILNPLLNKYVDHVSISADAKTVVCSECGKPTRPERTCGHSAHEIIRDFEVKELSVVATPAYEKTGFVVGFAASVDKKLNGGKVSQSIQAQEEKPKDDEKEKRAKDEDEDRKEDEDYEAGVKTLAEEVRRLKAELRKLKSEDKDGEKQAADEGVSPTPKETARPPATQKTHSPGSPVEPTQASQGRSVGRVNADDQKPKNSFETALREIYGFAASRGTVPLT